MTSNASTPVARNTTTRQQLYRMYDAAGVLLYIGISTSAVRRLTEHVASQPWIAEVARVDIETHDVDRARMLEIERDAIVAERPRYNHTHNTAREPYEPSDVVLLHDLTTWPDLPHLMALVRAVDEYARRLDALSRKGGPVPTRRQFIEGMTMAVRCLPLGDSTCKCRLRWDMDFPVRVYATSPDFLAAVYQCQECGTYRKSGWSREYIA
jgi:hypothetical protein